MFWGNVHRPPAGDKRCVGETVCGQNVGKYTGITLPGGVTLDGDAWYDKGKQEADDIEEHIMTMLSPLEMVIG